MPCIYPFEIKNPHILLRNDGPSKFEIANCNFFAHWVLYWARVAKILQKKIRNIFAILQYWRTIISEKNMILFNFKRIYAWHFYGTRRFLLFLNHVTFLHLYKVIGRNLKLFVYVYIGNWMEMLRRLLYKVPGWNLKLFFPIICKGISEIEWKCYGGL